jgi:glucokinase
VTHVLAADIGGTHVRLCIAHCERGTTRIVREHTYASAAYARFADVLREFLSGAPGNTIAAACFAVAGPVRETATGQAVKITNLPWEIGAAALEREFGLPKVRLINDFQAIGYGIDALQEPDFAVLEMGNPVRHGPRAVIGAGTGLGQAILVWQQDRYEVIATEGGHADFGPTDELQVELARYLIKECGRASYELILSGPGLVRLYEFLHSGCDASPSPTLDEAMKTDDPAAAITRAALGGDKDYLAAQALDLFVRIYGAQVGNLALTVGATGGLYLAGGIAPKIISKLKDGAFLDAFRSKGNMSAYVKTIPVWVVMNPKVGLMGAAMVAGRL